jgi:phage tail-like protein
VSPTELAAAALPAGNRIALTWRPAPAAAGPPQQVRVLRRTGAYPAELSAGEWVGQLVADTGAGAPVTVETLPDGRRRVLDTGLAAETVYYYQLLTYPRPSQGAAPVYRGEPALRVAVMATGPYEFADRMYALLPAVYRRFDTALAAPAPAELERGQLRRFLALPGGQLDQLYSTIRSLPDLADVSRVDGRLLPLLAHWVGWRTDHRLGFDEQRREIRDAAARYRTVQTVASVEAVARRITGWPVRSREFVDNVGITNRPPRLTLWLEPSSTDRPLSLDEAHHGRPAVVVAGGTVRLVYATLVDGRDELWQKVHDGRGWQPSGPVLTGRGRVRDPAAAATADGTLLLWTVHDPARGWRVEFRLGAGPARPFGTGADDPVQRRDPAVLVEGDALWLFWRELDGRRWALRYRRLPGPAWDPSPAGARSFPLDGTADPRVESAVSLVLRDTAPRLGVVWARRQRFGPRLIRWRLAIRFKNGTNPQTVDDWGPVRQLDVDTTDGVDDREPFALDPAAVYFASTRGGSSSVWRAGFAPGPGTWDQPRPVTDSPAADRAPVAFPLGGQPAVVYRSSRPVRYPSSTYPATSTVDRRYAGSVTVRTTDRATAGGPDDSAAHTVGCRVPGAAEQGNPRISPQTLGLYLDAGDATPATVAAARDRLRAVLPEFMPATHDAALIVSGSGGGDGDQDG